MMLSESDLGSSEMYYFELLHINPLQANFSFITVIDEKETPCGTLFVSYYLSHYSRESAALEELFSYIGALADIDGAPIKLNGLILENPFTKYRLASHFSHLTM